MFGMRTLSVIAVMIFLTAGGYAMIMTLSIDDLVITSDAIVIADIKTGKQIGKDENEFTKVESIVNVFKVLKGEIKPETRITVQTVVGFEDEVILKPGQRGILFLKKDVKTPALFHVNNFVQGFWPLDNKGKPTGMGEGISIANIEEIVVKTKDRNPTSKTVEPEF